MSTLWPSGRSTRYAACGDEGTVQVPTEAFMAVLKLDSD